MSLGIKSALDNNPRMIVAITKKVYTIAVPFHDHLKSLFIVEFYKSTIYSPFAQP